MGREIAHEWMSVHEGEGIRMHTGANRSARGRRHKDAHRSGPVGTRTEDAVQSTAMHGNVSDMNHADSPGSPFIVCISINVSLPTNSSKGIRHHARLWKRARLCRISSSSHCPRVSSTMS